MNIIIVLNDTMSKYNEYQATGVLNQVNRRSVEFELSKDQIELIRKQDHESIESISLTISTEKV